MVDRAVASNDWVTENMPTRTLLFLWEYDVTLKQCYGGRLHTRISWSLNTASLTFTQCSGASIHKA